MQDKILNISVKNKKRNQIYQKIIITLLCLALFRLGNLIPLPSLDKTALEDTLTNVNQNLYLAKMINMYSTGGSNFLSAFSLGIIPYINASILVDLLTSIAKPLENLQEEGEAGKKKLSFYKKLLALFISIFQSFALLNYFKDYFYDFNNFSFILLSLVLMAGSMVSIYITNKIDSSGIGNGTSLIIFTNIVLAFIKNKDSFLSSNFLEVFLVFLFLLWVTILQKARINVPLISARQLAFLTEGKGEEKTSSKKAKLKKALQFEENGLAIKFNQAGIFPIIIASNLAPLFSFIQGKYSSFFLYLLYNLFIVSFNYFYTLIFWDPEKISKQLSKASVSVVDTRPGKETLSYLQNLVKSSSLVGGLALSFLVIFYDLSTKFFDFSLLEKVNISSLIILTGVAFDTQKSLCSFYQSLQDESIEKI